MITSNADKIRESFAVQAENFNSSSMNFSKEEYLKHTVSLLNPSGSENALETAAGTCACGRALAPFVRSVSCIDLTPEMLGVGRAEAMKSGLVNMSFIRGNILALPFRSGSFDIAVSRLSFHHFPDTRRPMSEMVRVVKAGGRVMLIDMEAADEALRSIDDELETMRDPSHVKKLTIKEIEALFEANGLSVILKDKTEIPVSLNAWLALTKTPADISAVIEKRLSEEIDGGEKTGFAPYRKDGSIFFKQRWLSVIGEKK